MHELPPHLDFSSPHFNFRPAPTYVNPNPPLCIPGPINFHHRPPLPHPTTIGQTHIQAHCRSRDYCAYGRRCHCRHRLPLTTVATAFPSSPSPLSPPPSPRHCRHRRHLATAVPSPLLTMWFSRMPKAVARRDSGVTKRSKNYDLYDGI